MNVKPSNDQGNNRMKQLKFLFRVTEPAIVQINQEGNEYKANIPIWA